MKSSPFSTPPLRDRPADRAVQRYLHRIADLLDLGLWRWHELDRAEPVTHLQRGGDVYREPDGGECRGEQYESEGGVCGGDGATNGVHGVC